MADKGFGDRLRKLRLRAKLSQSDLSKRTGLTIRQISRIETGEQGPSWNTALALAVGLEVQLSELAPKASKRKGK